MLKPFFVSFRVNTQFLSVPTFQLRNQWTVTLSKVKDSRLQKSKIVGGEIFRTSPQLTRQRDRIVVRFDHNAKENELPFQIFHRLVK